MPTPDFVLSLREKVGHELLWLSGVTGVVLDDGGRVLLGRRADTGAWSLPSGILEPGEQPADGLAREVLEETCVAVEVESLVSVWTQPEMTYPNGDRSRYLDLVFRCRHASGEPGVGDGELTEVAWFAPDELPGDLRQSTRDKLGRALAHRGAAWFERPPEPARPAPLATLHLADPDPADRSVVLRRATTADLPVLVRMLAGDRLGATREDTTDLQPYAAALAAIDVDPAHLLVVADDGSGPVGMVQLSILPGLSRAGASRGLLEGVRVAASHRGSGLGSAMITWTVQECRRRGCAMVQLTSDQSRVDARRFYERLGFVASHVGMKLPL